MIQEVWKLIQKENLKQWSHCLSHGALYFSQHIHSSPAKTLLIYQHEQLSSSHAENKKMNEVSEESHGTQVHRAFISLLKNLQCDHTIDFSLTVSASPFFGGFICGLTRQCNFSQTFICESTLWLSPTQQQTNTIEIEEPQESTTLSWW